MKNKQLPSVLIVGQGLAGSILGFQLHQAGCQIQLIDSPNTHFTSSVAAGGLFNPVTGRKLEQTWLADQIFPFLFSFYPQLEKKLQAAFFHPMPLFRPFANDEMRIWLLERKEQIDHHFLDWKEQGVFINQSGWVDVAQMLKAFESFFVHHQLIKKQEFLYQNLQLDQENQVHYDGVKYDFIIFCEGFHAQKNNPFFGHLCFLPAKGELLKITTQQADEQLILNKNGFLLPISQHQFKVGATYSWDDLSQNPRPQALDELRNKVAQFDIDEYTIDELLVGVRPATQDRRPFVGLMPGKPIGIFNGFGSKGVSLIPYFAHQFVENLIEEKEINAEVSIRRFSHLFSI